jgi:MFS family permease
MLTDHPRFSSSNRQTTFALIAVFVTYFVYSVNYYGLNVAAPKVAAELNGMTLYSWALSIPALASAFATLIFGKLSDMYGRRIMLTAATICFILGGALSAVSQDFIFNIGARFILSIGHGTIAPLCFSVIGDLFDPTERSRWSGMLAIPAGINAFIVPTLVGIIADSLSWRYYFWILTFLGGIASMLVLFGIPPLKHRTAHKIDFLGSMAMALASATMIVGFSLAGTAFPWGSFEIIGLFGVSIIAWVFFLRTEKHAAEPILDLKVLTNRTFLTAALAAIISFFGIVGITSYFPLFLQGVKNVSATLNGQMITPFSMLMTSMGIPAGFLLARTKRYKWMYIAGYAIFSIAMIGMTTLSANTPIWFDVLVTALAGLGLGTIPTLNALVVQFAVPRRLLGVAVSALYFFVSMGTAIAPAILGSVVNTTYNSALQNSLPYELQKSADATMLTTLGNPRVLLSPQAMTSLKESFDQMGASPQLFDQTIIAIRSALENSLRTIYIIGAVGMLISFLLITTIPEIPIDVHAADKQTLGSSSAIDTAD